MEYCKGLGDWLSCTKCKYICTSQCPIEGSEGIVELATKLKVVEVERSVQLRTNFN